jgi:hypothetical protein
MTTSAGQIVNFAVGGVLAPDSSGQPALAPATQQLVQTFETGAAEGSAAIVTASYDDSDTLCGIPLTNFVTSASLAAAPTPTSTPTPTPAPTPAPASPTSAPVFGSATGTVTQMSAAGLISQPGTGAQCEEWQGALTTASGQIVKFTIETGLSGSSGAGFTPTNLNAVPIRDRLVQAQAEGKRAVATIHVIDSQDSCGLPLTNVVTRASVVVHQSSRRKTKSGLVAKLSRPTVLTSNGASCEIWSGAMKTRSGATFSFALESRLTNGHANQRAVNIVKTLKRARADKRRATITYAGPIEACGKIVPHVVSAASL